MICRGNLSQGSYYQLWAVAEYVGSYKQGITKCKCWYGISGFDSKSKEMLLR